MMLEILLRMRPAKGKVNLRMKSFENVASHREELIVGRVGNPYSIKNGANEKGRYRETRKGRRLEKTVYWEKDARYIP